MSILEKFFVLLFGKKSEKDYKALAPLGDKIKEKYSEIEGWSENQLKERISGLREEIQQRKYEARELGAAEKLKKSEIENNVKKVETDFLDEIMLEVFAIVKAGAAKLVGQDFKVMGQDMTWNMVHFDVQLLGGIVLHQGKIAEMKTGEGKTLVSTLPIILNAITGRGVHIITVNDYLAQRDSEWMGHLFEYFGFSVGCVLNQMETEDRKEMYQRDICYGTNSEFGFDYLRDNMAISPEEQVQRGHYFAIVDEVDSVLIDEARTPLIIAGQVDAPENKKFQSLRNVVASLVRKQARLVNEILAEGERQLDTDEQKAGILLLRASRGMPKNNKLMKILQQTGVKQLIRRVESDYIRDKKMAEIDEELYFVIEEKNNIIDLTDIGRKELSPNAPDDWIIPDIGEEYHRIDNDDGLNDEAKLSAKDEIQSIHGERSEKIHTLNQLLKAYTLFEKDVDYIVQENKVLIVDEHTGRVMHGRRYSDGLHQALESKEQVTIEKETQTVATITIQNYFRMYEKLAGMTGTAVTESAEFGQIYNLDVVETPTNRAIVRKDHEDRVYKTKREKFNAIVDKIVELNKKGQPILVGTTSVEESEKLSRILGRTGIKHYVLNAKKHQMEAEIVANAGKTASVTISTNMAGRGTDIKLDDESRKLGGLFILGTGRHESRRIDLQLRGRSGRQGDPGESIFFLSLEDDLMRLFSSDRVARVMDRLGIDEGEVITHSMITKSIERAQKKVEGHNFSIRKHLLEYDDVMNNQRQIVYDRRNYALHGDNIVSEFKEILGEYLDSIFEPFGNENPVDWDWDEIHRAISDIIVLQSSAGVESVTDVHDLKAMGMDKIISYVIESAVSMVHNRIERLPEHEFENYMKFIILRTIDVKWREHLYGMDRLREGINLRAYGQKNPLLEYKAEGFAMFREMMRETNHETLQKILKVRIEVRPQMQQAQVRNISTRHDEQSGFTAPPNTAQQRGDGFGATAQQQQSKTAPRHVEQKIHRNALCPCGSGKKYKKCHGSNR